MKRNYGEKQGFGYIKAEPFKKLSDRSLKAISRRLRELRIAQSRRDGVAASKAADLLCDLAMNAQSHFHDMQDRECHYWIEP